MSTFGAQFDESLLRRVLEKGPLSAGGLEQEAGDIDHFSAEDARAWAEDMVAEGFLEPSPAIPNAWAATDSSRRRLGS